MGSWGSYSSIFTMGHRAIADLLKHDVNVEEKVDGSQFGFGLFNVIDDSNNSYIELKVRSKGAVMHPDAPEGLFNKAVETVKKLKEQLHVDWMYRGEYLAKPKHNSLAYDRTPKDHIILFDIQTEDGGFLSYADKKVEADRLGLECVPLLYSGRITSIEDFRRYLTTTSVLGGQAIEGVVVKPSAYNLYGLDKKVLMGKFVSEAFKEVHRKSWGESNPTNKDIIQRVADSYTTQARWNKAILHLREAGKLVEDVQDIGPLIKEIPQDVLKECEADIKEELFKYAWPHIKRGLTRGFPEYYKELLLKRSFENQPPEQGVTGAETIDHIDSGVSTV